MTYVNIFATEARGMYSPPNGNDPQMIPDYWRATPSTEPRTDLPELSDAQLNALGWKGPIEFPEYDVLTHERVWNRETRSFDVIERSFPLDPTPSVVGPVDYKTFWNELMTSGAYGTLKAAASTDLIINTLCTEFIALFVDAKFGEPNVPAIQTSLTQIISSIPFTTEDLAEIQAIFTVTGLDQVYTLQ
jgi:hypothetical protein